MNKDLRNVTALQTSCLFANIRNFYILCNLLFAVSKCLFKLKVYNLYLKIDIRFYAVKKSPFCSFFVTRNAERTNKLLS